MKKIVMIIIGVLLIPGFAALAQTSINNEFPAILGHMKFNTQQLNLQNLNNTETRTDTIKMMNDWNQSITLSFTVPDYIKATAVPSTLKPQQKGYIIVAYDGVKRNDFGFLYDRLNIKTNDSLQPEKSIGISVNIVEDFSKMTPAQLAKAPKITFDKTTYEFGTITEGDKVETDFKFTNEGKNELIIRKTKGSCGCTVGNPEKSNLQPGESSNLHVIFNSQGKSGQQTKTITVITNDPKSSSLTLTLTGKVDKKTDPNTQQPQK